MIPVDLKTGTYPDLPRVEHDRRASVQPSWFSLTISQPHPLKKAHRALNGYIWKQKI